MAFRLQHPCDVAGAAPTTEVRIRAAGSRQRGRYVLGELLGRGGMAEVFAGHALGSHGFQKPVAIKRLLPELADDAAFVDRLIAEAKLLVGMQHGNIVSVLDLVRETDDVFLVMEYVDGPSLRQLVQTRSLRKFGPLPLGVATYIVQGAAAGLEFAHVRPGGAIVHADISPSNLLLTASGEVKVADFGIARREGVGLPGIVEGKWAYMAPEQARCAALSPRSDVFSLGVVLYELITGVHPFAHCSRKDVREAAALIAVPPPRALRHGLPPALDELCLRAMAHDPRERLASMQHLVDGLVEQRFTHGWRDGAAEVAAEIRDVRVGRAAPVQRTQVTGRPVTIITSSLLSENALAAVEPPSQPRTASARPPRPPPAPALRPDGTPTRFPGVDLAQGTGHGAVEAIGLARAPTAHQVPHLPRWLVPAVTVFGAFIVIAAVTLGILSADTPAPRPLAREVPRPVIQPIEVPPAAVAPAAPAPAAVAPVVAEPPAPPPPRPTARPSRTRAPRAARAVEPAPAPTGDGMLRIFAEPWAYVRIAGRDEVETPARIKLPAGDYTVKLFNPETGAHKTLRVTIRSGETETRSVGMEPE